MNIAVKAAAVVIAAAGIAVTGCSSGSSAPPTPASVAHQIGATNLRPFDKGPFASAAKEATWHGRSIVIAVFATDAAKKAYIQAVSALGQGEPLMEGALYVVYPN